MLPLLINFIDGSAMDHPEGDSVRARLLWSRAPGLEGKDLVDNQLTNDWGPIPWVCEAPERVQPAPLYVATEVRGRGIGSAA